MLHLPDIQNVNDPQMMHIIAYVWCDPQFRQNIVIVRVLLLLVQNHTFPSDAFQCVIIH